MDKVDLLVEIVYGQVCIRPCPYCHAHSRHPKRRDPRGPIGVNKNLFFCHECGEGGKLDKIGVELSKEQLRCADQHKPLPPKASLDRFWSYCTEVYEGSEAHDYLKGRFNRAELTLPQNLVRRLPDFTLETDEIKGWYRKYKVIFPLCDEAGNLRNVIARSVAKTPKIKSMSLRGYTRAGLCLAYKRDPQKVVVCEGEADWLAWSLFGPEEATVYGIFAGSIPNSGPSFLDEHRYAEVLIATDLDEAGDKYAEEVRERLKDSHCKISRWSPSLKRVNDACDVLKKGGELVFEGLL